MLVDVGLVSLPGGVVVVHICEQRINLAGDLNATGCGPRSRCQGSQVLVCDSELAGLGKSDECRDGERKRMGLLPDRPLHRHLPTLRTSWH